MGHPGRPMGQRWGTMCQLFGAEYTAVRRDPAECANDRSIGGTRETPCDPDAGEPAAVVQGDLARDVQHAFPHDPIGRGNGRKMPLVAYCWDGFD